MGNNFNFHKRVRRNAFKEEHAHRIQFQFPSAGKA